MKAFYSYLAVAFLATLAVAETIQLESTQGILIPAPIAQRLARAAYGAYGPATFQGPSSSSSSSASSGASSSASSGAISGGSSVPISAGGSLPAYNVPSIPSPPCPRNYLFSCAPNLTPVPCAQSAGAPSYGVSSPSFGVSSPSFGVSSPSFGVSSPSFGGQSSSSFGSAAPSSSSAYLQATNPQGAYSDFIPQYLYPGIY